MVITKTFYPPIPWRTWWLTAKERSHRHSMTSSGAKAPTVVPARASEERGDWHGLQRQRQWHMSVSGLVWEEAVAVV